MQDAQISLSMQYVCDSTALALRFVTTTAPETHRRTGLHLARGFRQDVDKLEPRERRLVWDAVIRYSEDPAHPGLRFHRLNGTLSDGQLWSIRASGELRVVLSRERSATVFVGAGHHDAAYEGADRRKTPQAPSGMSGPAGPEMRSERTATPNDARESSNRHSASPAFERSRPVPTKPDGPQSERPLLWMWTTDDLIETGFDRTEADQLRRATESNAEDVLLAGWPGDDAASQRAELLDRLLELAELHPDEWRSQQLTDAERAAAAKYARDITELGAVAALSIDLSSSDIERLAEAPIEDWMIFLHPTQRDAVERRFRSSARIRGSAGTGKTVVALHRAAWLAKHPPERDLFAGDAEQELPILFTTYIKSLVHVLENLYLRLPTGARDAVKFVNIDQLAVRLCQESGVPFRTDRRALRSTFAVARKDVVKPGTPLHRLDLSDGYLQEEVVRVIKGRGVDDLESYCSLQRLGREVAFQRPVREQMWELHLHWRELTKAAGIEHHEDAVRRARDYARSLDSARYRSIIVDEAQDLTQTGLELLVALVAQRVRDPEDAGTRLKIGPDSLLVVGDGAQKVYPGGFVLAAAGVDIRGSSIALQHNYRNTRQIIETAMACTGEQVVDDLGESYTRMAAQRETDRDGVPPRLIVASDSAAQLRAMVSEIQALCTDRALSLGDFGAFAATNNDVDAAMQALREAGLNSMNLKDYRGQLANAVKVGTFDRAKGLEFKVVFLLGISHRAWPFTASGRLRASERADAEVLAATKLFVAMTRARDALYVLCSEKHHQLLDRALDHFERSRFIDS